MAGTHTTSIISILMSIVFSPEKNLKNNNSENQDVSLHVHKNKSTHKKVGKTLLPMPTTGRTRFSHNASQNSK